MNERHVGYRIRHYLNQEGNFDPKAIARLRDARRMAVERQRVTARPPAFVVIDGAIARLGSSDAFLTKFLLPTLVLILGLISIHSWRQAQLADEIEEIDTAVLTGELPIDAYVDTGFDAWLKRSSQ